MLDLLLRRGKLSSVRMVLGRNLEGEKEADIREGAPTRLLLCLGRKCQVTRDGSLSSSSRLRHELVDAAVGRQGWPGGLPQRDRLRNHRL